MSQEKINEVFKQLMMREINMVSCLNDYRKRHPKNSKTDVEIIGYYEGKLQGYRIAMDIIQKIFSIREMPIVSPVSLRENPET